MNVLFTPAAWEDYQWFQTHDRQRLKRLNQLIRETMRTPFTGTGKPELLRGNLSGHWSRRIDSEHRLVYRVADNTLIIIACRFHYDD